MRQTGISSSRCLNVAATTESGLRLIVWNYWRIVLLLAEIVVISGLMVPSVSHAELDWRPERTWVFAVGVLKWQHPDVWKGMANAEQNRRDAEIVRYFQTSGVTENRIIYLQDQHATRSRIQEELMSLLKKTRPDDLLVFYFAGHGFRDRKHHEVHFANYDATEGPNAWHVRSIFDTLESHFQGGQVLLMADCCYSGGLIDEARLRKTRLGYCCLCSSYSHNSSTGRWTFTDALLAGLRGHPTVDLNADGEIDVGELGQYCEMEMAFAERQKAVYDNNRTFPARWRIAKPQHRGTARQGERIEVEWKEKWFRAEISESSEDRCKIHYIGFADSWDEWVGPDRMRPFQPKHIDEGTSVDVRWGKEGKWYPAKVVRSWYGLTFVHYEGYPDEWNEWVNFDAIRSADKSN